MSNLTFMNKFILSIFVIAIGISAIFAFITLMFKFDKPYHNPDIENAKYKIFSKHDLYYTKDYNLSNGCVYFNDKIVCGSFDILKIKK